MLDNFEYLGFWLHRHENTVLSATWMMMWLLSTLAFYADATPARPDLFRLSSSFETYGPMRELQPLIGDYIGVFPTTNLLFTPGSNADDANILTAARMKDVVGYHDIVTRGVSVCRHKLNGKVKVPCNHRMVRVFNYNNDCKKLQSYTTADQRHGNLHQRNYDPLMYKTVMQVTKANHNLDFSPEFAKEVTMESISCPSCKYVDMKGSLKHCASELTPIKSGTLTFPDNPNCCNCISYSFGHTTPALYKGFQMACEKCWNHDLDEPMPICTGASSGGMTGFKKCSLIEESFGSCIADGKLYENVARYKIRSGTMSDPHFRVWLRKLYHDPNQDMTNYIGGISRRKITDICGSRKDVLQKCKTWKSQTGADRILGIFGEARCIILKKYNRCVENNMKGSALILSYSFFIKRWGNPKYANPMKNQWLKAYEDVVLAMVVGKAKGRHHHQALNHVKVYLTTTRTFALELVRVIFGFFPVYIIGGVFVTLSMFFFLGRIHWVDGRGLLGVFSIFSALNCMSGAFGCAYIFGHYASVLSFFYLYLVVLAVAVDDMIIIVDTFERIVPPVELEDREDQLAFKISQALREVGPAITMTTLTTCMAFLVGVTSPFPYVGYVCMAGFYAFALDYIYQILFFIPLVLKDERRRLKSKWHCCPCFCEWPDQVQPMTAEERRTTKIGVLHQINQAYVLPLVKDWRFVTFTSTILFVTLCLSISTVPIIKTESELGIPRPKRYSATSYASEFIKAYQSSFGETNPKTASIYVKDFDMNNRQRRKDFRMYLDHLNYEMSVKQRYGENAGRYVNFFYQPFKPLYFEKFHNDRLCSCNQPGNKCKHPYTSQIVQYGRCQAISTADEKNWGPYMRYMDRTDESAWPKAYIMRYRPTYREQLHLLLATPGVGQPFQPFIWVKDNEGHKVTFIIFQVVKYFVRDGLTVMEYYHKANEVYQSYKLGDGFMYIALIDHSERSYRMFGWIWDILISLNCSIWLVLIFFIPFWAATVASLMVFILQIHIWGMVYVFGLHLSLDVLVALTSTCGICVDEIVHSLYAIIYSHGTREERLHETVVITGSSVVKGSISTLIGISLLSLSPTALFRAYFVVCFSLCLVGDFVGIVLVPGWVAMLIGDNPHPEDKYLDDDMDDEKQVELGNLDDNKDLSVIDDCEKEEA